jgi:DNA-binding CsgD family transcriptional regulator
MAAFFTGTCPAWEARMDAARKRSPAYLPRAPMAPLGEVGQGERRGSLRHAAVGLDRTPRAVGKSETARAFLVWEGLVRGRLTLVDWFDLDGRRFILVKPKTVRSGYACGLTRREQEVAMSAALGESSKLTGYRLGISPSRVSTLLRAAMRKLGVRTKAQLVVMVRVLVFPPQAAHSHRG